MAKVTVNEDVCIGCETCVHVTDNGQGESDVFEIKDGVSKVKKGFDFEKNKAKIEETIDQCPVSAISIEEE